MLKKQLSEFRSYWKKKYFVDCRCKTDRIIQEQDIQNNHLILFGNRKSNRIIKKIVQLLLLKIEHNRIIIKQRQYQGVAFDEYFRSTVL